MIEGMAWGDETGTKSCWLKWPNPQRIQFFSLIKWQRKAFLIAHQLSPPPTRVHITHPRARPGMQDRPLLFAWRLWGMEPPTLRSSSSAFHLPLPPIRPYSGHPGEEGRPMLHCACACECAGVCLTHPKDPLTFSETPSGRTGCAEDAL